jgi:hypothetical protein
MIFGIMGWTMIFGGAMMEGGSNHRHHSIIKIIVSLRESLLPKMQQGKVRVKA